jgi:GNAT superfamily N-acetyltransferase
VNEANIDDWRFVHNAVIPTAPLSIADTQERRGRNALTVAYVGEDLVGCATVRPPNDQGVATVIARVLPLHRRLGYGEAIYLNCLRHARDIGGKDIETIVLVLNEEGLRFAHTHGFIEVARHFPHGQADPFVTLRLQAE